MENQPAASLVKHFEGLADPRRGNAKAHIFLEILIIAILAVICGADGWSDVELFGKNKKAWLKTFLKLPKGIPSHDTFGRVFAKIKPEEFQKRFMEWVQAVETLTAGQVIAVDGKKLHVPTIMQPEKRRFTWSAPGRPKTNSCWGRPKWPKNPMRLPRSQNCCNCWIFRVAL